jgi:hypothetical protein
MISKVEERLSETTRIRASSRQGASNLDDSELDAIVLDFLQTVRRLHMYIYIYIYIERERERERDIDMYIYI